MVVLNIDDDSDDGFFFMEAVKAITPEATCLLITSGDNAVELLAHDMGVLPDYIFLDINMPGMDGRECLMKLRNMAKLKNVPIVMFSTSIGEIDKKNFCKLNASSVQKPSDFQSLKTVIQKIIVAGHN